jgi:ribosomal protein L7/L12
MDDLRAPVRHHEVLVHHLHAAHDVERPAPDADVSAEVRALVAKGNLIGAIKAYREETGCDLRTARDVVESLR